MKIISQIKITAVLISIVAILSCDTVELDLLDSPNALNNTNASADFYSNAIQLNLKDFFFEVTEPGMEVTRILHMFGPLYQNAYAPSLLDDAWEYAYSEIMADVRSLQPLAEAEELYTHIAIAQVAEAYVITTLVDYLGDIPYTQSNNIEFLNPEADAGADIYSNMISLLDTAIENFNKEESRKPDKDFYYGGDEDKWIKLANTLKLKIYLQQRLVGASEATSAINAIVSSGNYIQTAADDFQFNFGTVDTNPDSRHPIFARNFVEGTGVTDYMSNTFMNYLVNDTDNEDPRRRYYFYRQRNQNAVNTVEQSCYGALPPAHVGFNNIFCNLGDEAPGYWGRDHGYDFGIPPDTNIRATWGLYPVGGNFDNESFTAIPDRNIGTKGAGIEPIMLSSFVDFMLAEAALTIGIEGTAVSYLEDGITKSISKVTGFKSELVDSNYVPSSDEKDAYIAEIIALYNAASNDDEKLNIIVKEYFKALWGNGVEAYNTYRRTGKPNDLQPLVREPATNFLRSFFYPDNYVNQNINATQKDDVTTKVFWDTNPDNGFIN
jgi:hypothetical protein